MIVVIHAPPALRVLRDELPPRPHDSVPARQALVGRESLARGGGVAPPGGTEAKRVIMALSDGEG